MNAETKINANAEAVFEKLDTSHATLSTVTISETITVGAEADSLVARLVEQARRKMLEKAAVRGTFGLMALSLAACKSDDGSSLTVESGQSVSGLVIKGPLQGAFVFADLNNDGIFSVGEPNATTATDGSYTLTGVANSGFTVIATTSSTTIDGSTGLVLDNVTLKAPAGSAVISPITTLIEETGLSAAAVATALGVPDGVDVLSFNPYAAGVDTATALSVENLSQQIVATMRGVAAAAEGAGLSRAAASDLAMKAVAGVVTTNAGTAGAAALNFSNAATITTIVNAAATAAVTAGADETRMSAVKDAVSSAISNVNDKISTVTDLTSTASKAIFATSGTLASEANAAATAGTVGSITLNEAANVDSAATALEDDVEAAAEADSSTDSDTETGDETDDHSNTRDISATLLELGGAANGEIERNGDVDVFRLQVTLGQQYTVSLNNIDDTDLSSEDTYLVIYNVNGLEDLIPASKGETNSFTFEADGTGTAYFEVNNSGSVGPDGNTYAVTINEGDVAIDGDETTSNYPEEGYLTNSPIRLQGMEGLMQDRYPQISEMNSQDIFLVTWQGETLNGNEIFVQPFKFINSDGGVENIEAAGAVSRLEGFKAGPMNQAPKISSLSEDGFVIVWQGNSEFSQEWDIFAQRFNAEGKTMGEVSNLRGALGMLRDQAPQVSPLWDGGFVVTWEGLTSDGQSSDIFVQQFNKEGIKDGGTTRLQGMSGNLDDVSPQVSAFSNGGFVVTWEGSTSDGQGKDIFVQRFDLEGLQEGDTIRLRGMSGDLLDWQPQVSTLPENHFAITWTGNTLDSQGWDIFVQVFNEVGDTVGEISRLRGVFGEFEDYSPRITALDNGGFVVVWQGNTSDDEGFDIFVQKFDLIEKRDKSNVKDGFTLRLEEETIRLEKVESIVSLSEGQSVVKVMGLPTGAIINIPDIKSDEYNPVTIIAMGIDAVEDTLTFNFVDENDIVFLDQDSVIVNFSTIKIIRGTVDFTAIPQGMLDGVTILELSADVTDEHFKRTETFVGDWYPQVSALEGNNFVVTWSGGTSDGQSYDIFLQQFGDKDIIHSLPMRTYGIVGDVEDWAPQVTKLSDVGFVVTWQGGTKDGQGRDIFVQFFPEILHPFDMIF